MVQRLEVLACRQSPILPLSNNKTCLGNNRLRRAWAADRTQLSKCLRKQKPSTGIVGTQVEVAYRKIATLLIWLQELKEALSPGARALASQIRTSPLVAQSRATMQAAGKVRKVAAPSRQLMESNRLPVDRLASSSSSTGEATVTSACGAAYRITFRRSAL